MNLSRTSVFHKLYEYTYFKSPGNNFCPFFWYSLIAIIFLPVTFITNITKCYRIINERHNNIEYGEHSNISVLLIRIVSFIILIVILSVLIFMISLLITGIYLNPMGGLYVLGIIIGTIILIISCVTGFTVITSQDAYKDTKAIIKTKKESVMDKYCPKINWKD